MTYRDRFIWIEEIEVDEKSWVAVKILTADRYFVPSFEQLAMILRSIAMAERQKYPLGGLNGRDPAIMLHRLVACAIDVARFPTWESIRRELQIPEKKFDQPWPI